MGVHTVAMIQGCDVSQYQSDWKQPNIDWPILASKARFVFIRMVDGTLDDLTGKTNWKNAKATGIFRGAYAAFYPYIDPRLQAQAFVNSLQGDLGELPLVVDIESPARTWSSAYIANAQIVLEEVERLSGVHPIIYTGNWFWPQYIGLTPWAANYKLWNAYYTYSVDKPPVNPAPWKAYTFWQFTNLASGTEYGCTPSNTIDLDVCSEADWAVLTGKLTTTVQIAGKNMSLPLTFSEIP